MSGADDLIAPLSPVAAAVQRLRFGYSVVGSVASTYHGAIRSTIDVDLVCNVRSDQVTEFISTFGPELYGSEAAVERRLARGGAPAANFGVRDQ